MENKKQNTELADIFGRYQTDFLQNHKLCPEQAKAYKAIVSCRTSALGGHTDCCDHCGHTRQSYNSCRNRHCPKCQYIKQVQWVDKLKANLIPVRYFHIVFTIPQCLHKTFYINQHVAYGLMFKAAGEALRICAANPKYLGADRRRCCFAHLGANTDLSSTHPCDRSGRRIVGRRYGVDTIGQEVLFASEGIKSAFQGIVVQVDRRSRL